MLCYDFPLFHLLPKYFFILDTQLCVFRWWYSPQWLEPAYFYRLVCKHGHLLHNSREMIIFLGEFFIDEVECTADTFCPLGNNDQ